MSDLNLLSVEEAFQQWRASRLSRTESIPKELWSIALGLCRQSIGSPYDGTVFAFRNKSGIVVKLLVYDSTGF